VNKQVYIIQVKVRGEKYYLTDLSITLSKNFKDAVIFNNKNSTCAFDGVVEKILEQKYETVVTCETIEMNIDSLLFDGVIPRTSI